MIKYFKAYIHDCSKMTICCFGLLQFVRYKNFCHFLSKIGRRHLQKTHSAFTSSLFCCIFNNKNAVEMGTWLYDERCQAREGWECVRQWCRLHHALRRHPQLIDAEFQPLYRRRIKVHAHAINFHLTFLVRGNLMFFRRTRDLEECKCR